MSAKPWFENWFDSPWYHILYQHRDEGEARDFLARLLAYLQPVPTAKMLDLACGRGRHTTFLHQRGFDSTGIDLSESNIAYAKQFEKPGLRFFQHDMREPYGQGEYDYIFNLFTSFGYFSQWEENLQAAKCMRQAIVEGGRLILDYMNVEKVKLGLVTEERKKIGETEFILNRHIGAGCIVKTIDFESSGKHHHFEERVQLFDLSDFEHLLSKAGFRIEATKGSFDLNDFDSRNSERLLIFATTK